MKSLTRRPPVAAECKPCAAGNRAKCLRIGQCVQTCSERRCHTEAKRLVKVFDAPLFQPGLLVFLALAVELGFGPFFASSSACFSSLPSEP